MSLGLIDDRSQSLTLMTWGSLTKLALTLKCWNRPSLGRTLLIPKWTTEASDSQQSLSLTRWMQHKRMYGLTYSSTHEVLTKVLSGMTTGTGRWPAELKSSNGRSRFPYLALTVVESDHPRLLLDALFSLTLRTHPSKV